jgi:hypothetical protein
MDMKLPTLVNQDEGTAEPGDSRVAAGPGSQFGKAQKARAQGTRILSESAFWHAIGVEVE